MTCVVLITQALAQVQITQVLYDPVGSESGGEFVEFKNSGNTSINLSGFVLATSSSMQDVVFSDIMIPAGSRFLLADLGWNNSRDNLSWPLADLEATMTLGNTNAGVALMNASMVIDAVGWGSPANPNLFSRTPALPVHEGFGLVRVLQSGNNSQDFVEQLPNLYKFFSEQVLVEVVVVADYVQIYGFKIAGESANTSLMPIPGKTRVVHLEANVSGANLNVTFLFFGKSYASYINNSLYHGDLEIPFSLAPGVYNVSLQVTPSNAEQVVMQTRQIVIKPVIAYEIENRTLGFGMVKPGKMAVSVLRPVVHNIGNVPIDVEVAATSLLGSGSSIPASSLLIHSSDGSYSLAKDQFLQIGLGPTQRYALVVDLLVPVPQAAGLYQGALVLRGVASE